jgi:hypothetical protein
LFALSVRMTCLILDKKAVGSVSRGRMVEIP